MKTLIAFYSRTGNNARIAKELQDKINADIEEIVDKDKRKGPIGFFKSGFEAFRKKKAEIEPIKKNPSDYDLIVITAPLWVGTVPPAIRTYMEGNKFKKVAYLSVCGSGGNNEKALPNFEELAGKKPIAYLMIKEKELEKKDYEPKLSEFAEKIKD